MRYAVDVGHGPLQQFGRQAFTGPCAEQFELFTAANQVAAPICQFVACCCVGFIQLLETITHFIQVLDKQHKLVVQPTGPLGNFTGVLALAFLLPQAVDHPQGGEQCGRADDHDVTVKGFLKQVGFGLQRR